MNLIRVPITGFKAYSLIKGFWSLWEEERAMSQVYRLRPFSWALGWAPGIWIYGVLFRV